MLHLLYSRFWHKVLYDIGVVTKKEPFQSLVSQGMILGEASSTPVPYPAHAVMLSFGLRFYLRSRVHLTCRAHLLASAGRVYCVQGPGRKSCG